MKFEVPKKHISRPHYPLTWSNGFCKGRGKRGALVEEGKGPRQRNYVITDYFLMKLCGKEKTKTRQDKRIIKLEQKIEIALFEHKVFSGYQHIHFLVHGHSS